MRKCFWCGVAGAGVGSFSMFKFPVEVELRQKWCAAMGTCVDKGDKKYLCCAHFNVADISGTKRKRLVRGAVPVKFVASEPETMTIERHKKRKRDNEMSIDFGRGYLQRIYVSWYACECCGEVCRVPNLKNTKSEFHGSDDGIMLCLKCQRLDRCRSGNFCKFSLALNQLDPGSIPEELRLGYMELQAVRIIQPFISLIRFPNTLNKGQGQMVHISSCVEKSVASLSRYSENKSLLSAVSQKKSDDGADESMRYSVSDVAVLEALRVLKNINSLYNDVDLNILKENLINAELQKKYTFEFVPLKFAEGIGRDLPHNSVPVWDMSGPDKHVEEKSYPNLFPGGDSGEHAERNYILDTPEYYKLRLLNGDNRFQKDVSYVFRALNIVQRHYLNSSINYMLRDGGKHVGFVANEDLLRRVYPKVGKWIRG